MADYKRYKTTTLKKMKEAAYEKHAAETMKPGEGWGAGYRKAHLCDYKAWERARERYYEICAELERRKQHDAGATG